MIRGAHPTRTGRGGRCDTCVRPERTRDVRANGRTSSPAFNEAATLIAPAPQTERARPALAMEQSPTISATSNASSCAEAVELLQLELEQGGTRMTRGDGVAERLKAVLEEATTSNDEDGVEVIVAHGGLDLAVVALDAHPQHAGVQVSPSHRV